MRGLVLRRGLRGRAVLRAPLDGFLAGAFVVLLARVLVFLLLGLPLLADFLKFCKAALASCST